MNRKLASAISVLFFILAIGGAALIGADPYEAIAAQEPQATHTVYITDAGPNPAELDVMVGDTVTWVNQTDQEQVIEGTTGAKVFLPLILRSAIAAAANEQSGEYLQAVSLEPAADTWGGSIPPGGSYSETFTDDGFYPYELPVHPGWRGLVRVRRIPPPLLTHTPTATATATGTLMPGTPTPTATATATSARTPTSTSTATATGTATSTATRTPTVTPTGTITAMPVVNHCGALTANETWGSQYVHRVTCNVTVPAGMTLTLQAGAIVKFQSTSTQLIVNGILTATGTQDRPVYLTSLKDDTVGGDTNNDSTATAPAKGDWGQLYVNSGGRLEMAYAEVRYGGNGTYSYPSNIALYDNATAILDRTTVRDSANDGIRLYATGTGTTGQLTFTNGTVRNNAQNGIQASHTSGTDQVEISNSSFIANGVSGASIWRGTTITLNNNTFTGNGSYGADINAEEVTVLTLGVNNGSGNGKNGIALSGTIAKSTTLTANPTFPYLLRVSADLTIANGATVTVQAGAVIKGEMTSSRLNLYGTLLVQGTAASPVYLTSLKDDTVGGDTNNDSTATTPAKGDWGQLYVNSGGRLEMAYAEVRYGGNGTYSYPSNIALYDNATAILDRTTVRDSANDGIRLYATGTGTTGQLTFTNGTVRNNGQNGIQASHTSGTDQVEISNSSFIANGVSGASIWRGTTITLNNNTFTGNGSYGADINAEEVTVLTLGVNNGSGNGKNGIALSGTIAKSTTLTANPTFPYLLRVSADLTIANGATVTVQAGAVIKGEMTSSRLNLYGTLLVQGTAASPVYLTSLKDDTVGGDTNNDSTATAPAKGDWGQLYVNSGGRLEMAYAEVRYGGNGTYSYPSNIALYDNATAILDRTTVRDSANDGIRLYATGTGTTGQLTFTNGTVRNNAQNGIQASHTSGTDQVEISNSSFIANGVSGASIWRGTTITLNNNTFTGNGSYGADINAEEVTVLTLGVNNGSGNGKNGIALSGTIAKSTTLTANPTFPYLLRVSADLTIANGATVTVQAGAVIKGEMTSSRLNLYGTLLVQGTAASPVYLTSLKDDTVGGDTNNDSTATAPAKGDWGQLYVNSGGRLEMAYAEVRYGGNGTYSYPSNIALYDNATAILDRTTVRDSANDGIRLYATGTGTTGQLTFTNGTVRNNAQNGIQASHTSGTDQVEISNSSFIANGVSGASIWRGTTITLNNNTFTGNGSYGADINAEEVTVLTLGVNNGSGNGKNGIALSGTIAKSTTLTANPTFPYLLRVSADLTIANGATVTVQAGAVIKGEMTSSRLNLYGTLLVQGTAASPVYLTSLKDDTVGGDTNNDSTATAPAKGDWGQLYVSSGGRLEMAYAEVRYGGNGTYSYPSNIALHNNATAILDHTTVRDSANDGIHLYAYTTGTTGQLTFTNGTVRNNGQNGIQAYRNGGAAYATIAASAIYGNGGYGVAGSSSASVIAENNWWGSDSGPAPYGSGNGINYRTCYNSTTRTYYICEFYVDADPWIGKGVATAAQLGRGGPLSILQAFVADPVNTANGNYSYLRTDLSMATRGLPLEFTRSYNSLAPQNGPLGYGWTHTWNFRLVEDTANSTVVITFGDGHGEKWDRVGSAYQGAAGVHGVLTKNGDGTFDLTQKDQTRYRFDILGRLAWVEDKNANRATLDYTGTLLDTVTAPDGRMLTFTYSSPVNSSLISQVADPTGRTVRYAYSAAGDLTSLTDVTGQVTNYTYDGNHRLLTAVDANSHTFARNVYDANGRVIEQYDAVNNKTSFAYDEPSHKTLVTNARGHSTTYEYDGDWRLTKETNPLSQSESYTYDAANNRLQITDRRGNVARFAYDTRGNTTTITDPLNFVTRMTYDARNNLLARTDPLDRVTTYTYDARSNLISRLDALGYTASWTYNAYGQTATATDARGKITSYTYDARGYPASVTDPLGRTMSFSYDAADRKLSETDPLGRTTSYTYDAANRLLTVTEPLGKVTTYAYDAVGNRTSIIDPRAKVTRFTYDAKDRLTTVADPLDHVTIYTYDAVDNQVSVTDALGLATTNTYDAANRRSSTKDALNHTTNFTYDPNGNRKSLTDANGKTTQYACDAMNRLSQVTDAAGGIVTYTYDKVGNRTSMTDANNHTTHYDYDDLDRLTTTTDPLDNIVTNEYDAVGNRKKQIRAGGAVIAYDYDDANQLTGISYPGGSISYAYDAAGNRTSMADTVGTATYNYDDLNRLTQVSGPNGALTYAYDLNDNRTSVTYPGGNAVISAYDAADRLTSVTDWAGRVTTYGYDEVNRLKNIQYPNGVQAAHAYDNADRLQSIVQTHATNGTITSATYTLDSVGNRKTMQDPDGLTSYTYDDLHRLTQVIYPNGESVTYTYDAMGNRKSLVSTLAGTTTYSYDAGDRLLSFAGPGGTMNLTWDADGRMTGKGAATFTYDALDRMTQAVSGGTIVQYAYDGDGVRLRKTVIGTATNYLQDVGAPLPIVVGEMTSGQTSRYVYGLDLVTQVSPAGSPAYYHADGLGSTRALSNAAGQRTDAYSYDAFGTQRAHSGGSVQPFTFTGEQADSELGLVYLRARYYDPDIARFQSRDQVPTIRTSSREVNRYAYAMNNPTYFLDPSGNISISTIWNNKYGRPAVNKTVDAAISVSDYASTIAKLAGEGSSDAGQSLDAAAQVGGAVAQVKDVHDWAVEASRDDTIYWAYREARSQHPDREPSRGEVQTILKYNLEMYYQLHLGVPTKLAYGVESNWGAKFVYKLFPTVRRDAETDAAYILWFQEEWLGQKVSGRVQGASTSRPGWGGPPGQGK